MGKCTCKHSDHSNDWPGLDIDESGWSVSQFVDALEDACDMKGHDHDEGLSREDWLRLLQLIGVILA